MFEVRIEYTDKKPKRGCFGVYDEATKTITIHRKLQKHVWAWFIVVHHELTHAFVNKVESILERCIRIVFISVHLAYDAIDEAITIKLMVRIARIIKWICK